MIGPIFEKCLHEMLNVVPYNVGLFLSNTCRGGRGLYAARWAIILDHHLERISPEFRSNEMVFRPFGGLYLVLGQNGRGQKGTDKMVRTKWHR